VTELLSFPFMQRALLAALLTGLIAPAIGIYIVQRRLSLLGDGLGHVAIAGVGLALLTGSAPIPVAVVVSVVGAVAVELLRQLGKATGDVGLAILFYGGLAAGVLMSGIAGAGAGALSQYLFGSLTTVTAADLRLVAVLAVVVLVPTVGLAPQLFAVCADEQHARTQGLPVRFYNVLIVVLAAVTVTLAMRTVGLLLVSALMVVPVAAAQNLVRGFYATLGCAMVVGVVVAVGGATGSYYADTAPGALIVVLAIAVFALSWPVPLLMRRRRLSPELPAAPPAGALDEVTSPHVVAEDAHPHRHDQACGHRAVQHGDHTDYLHEGHRHAAHADHYDEH
jgi:zinc transport system permease protein